MIERYSLPHMPIVDGEIISELYFVCFRRKKLSGKSDCQIQWQDRCGRNYMLFELCDVVRVICLAGGLEWHYPGFIK